MIDLVGFRFGRLTVKGLAGSRLRADGARVKRWECICDCGTATIVETGALRSGNTRSCGCLQREQSASRNSTHGMSRGSKAHPLYETWKGIKKRCLDPRVSNFRDYGGRGIQVCDRWLNGDGVLTGFECFLADMGERPEGLSIDRINNDGNYEPGNCRWATKREQMTNRRPAKLRRNIIPRGEIAAVRTAYASGAATCLDLAKKYGVGSPSMSAILTGKTYKSEGGPISLRYKAGPRLK